MKISLPVALAAAIFHLGGAPTAHAFKVNVCECSFIDCNPKSVLYGACKAITKPFDLEFIQIPSGSEAEMIKACTELESKIRWERHPRLSTDQARRLADGKAVMRCQPVEF